MIVRVQHFVPHRCRYAYFFDLCEVPGVGLKIAGALEEGLRECHAVLAGRHVFKPPECK
jgi:hypothetical protein